VVEAAGGSAVARSVVVAVVAAWAVRVAMAESVRRVARAAARVGVATA